MDDLRLAALLCTRLCHDLIGPAGAVLNGVELLSEDSGNIDDEVIELIHHSAMETTRRLKYFRISLGLPAAGQSLASTRDIADEYFAVSKITLEWSDGFMASTTPAALIPIMLNLILCGAEALPRGGRIAIDGAPEGDGFALHIKASGEVIKADDDALTNLSGGGDLATIEARGVAPYMAARMVSAAGGNITTTPSAGSMDFSVTLPAARPTNR